MIFTWLQFTDGLQFHWWLILVFLSPFKMFQLAKCPFHGFQKILLIFSLKRMPVIERIVPMNCSFFSCHIKKPNLRKSLNISALMSKSLTPNIKITKFNSNLCAQSFRVLNVCYAECWFNAAVQYQVAKLIWLFHTNEI